MNCFKLWRSKMRGRNGMHERITDCQHNDHWQMEVISGLRNLLRLSSTAWGLGIIALWLFRMNQYFFYKTERIALFALFVKSDLLSLFFHKEQIALLFKKVKRAIRSFCSSCSFKKSDWSKLLFIKEWQEQKNVKNKRTTRTKEHRPKEQIPNPELL